MRRLVAATGDPDVEITDIVGTVFDVLPEFNEEEIRRFLVSQSVFMDIGYAGILRNRMKLRRQEVQPYPNLRFGPSYAIATNDPRGQFWLSVLFEIPVWNMNQGNIRSAQAELRSSPADLDAKRLELLRELAEVAAEHASAKNSLNNIREMILPNALQAQRQVGEGVRERRVRRDPGTPGPARCSTSTTISSTPQSRPGQPRPCWPASCSASGFPDRLQGRTSVDRG